MTEQRELPGFDLVHTPAKKRRNFRKLVDAHLAAIRELHGVRESAWERAQEVAEQRRRRIRTAL
jgi:hypothetical protein